MSDPITRLFVAAHRGFYQDGTTYLKIVTPKTGLSFNIRETYLNEKGIRLGDFCTAKLGENNSLTDFAHTTHWEGLSFKVEGPIFAYTIVEGELVIENGIKVFKTDFFGKVVDLTQSTAPGMYKIKIYGLCSSHKKGALSAFSWGATAIEAIGAPSQLVEQVTAPMQKIHEGFKNVWVSKNIKTFKAVVTRMEFISRTGKYRHFVWILGECKTAILSSTDVYQPGIVIEGDFKNYPKQVTGEDQWSCVKVTDILTDYLTGRLKNGHVEIDVTISSYIPAGGAVKYPQTFNNDFGKIVDNKGKMPTNCINKTIAIQQRKLNDGHFHWVVVNVYN